MTITSDDLIAALKPFAFLCEMHDDEKIADSDAMVFPGSKVAVKMGDLRRAHALYFGRIAERAEADRRIRSVLKSRCPTCNVGAIDAYQITNPLSGLRASVTYACGHVFVGDAIDQARAVPA